MNELKRINAKFTVSMSFYKVVVYVDIVYYVSLLWGKH